MTERERAVLEDFVRPNGGCPSSLCGPVEAALAEIDRLCADLAATQKREQGWRWWQDQIRQSVDRRDAEIERLRTELAAAKARPTVLRCPRCKTEGPPERWPDGEHLGFAGLRCPACWEAGYSAIPEPVAMPWTVDRPTEPGWYWLSGGWAEDGVIVSVEIYPRLPEPVLVVWAGGYPEIPGDARWAGPIPGPGDRARENAPR